MTSSAFATGATQEETAENIIQMATEQALNILKGMQADRESFRKLGLTFEEKAFYDILIHLRDKNNFVYGEDREVDGNLIISLLASSSACFLYLIVYIKIFLGAIYTHFHLNWLVIR